MTGEWGKTVYLLGAGASHGSGHALPVMRGFFGSGESDCRALEKTTRASGLVDFLRWFYPETTPSDYNVEEVLSYLYFADSVTPRWTQRLRKHRADPTFSYETMLRVIRGRLAVPDGTAPCPLHRGLVRVLQPCDTVLTLNYDLVMDSALEAYDKPSDASSSWTRLLLLKYLLDPSFSPMASGDTIYIPSDASRNGFYLKLHGSLDWGRCSNETCWNRCRVQPIPELMREWNELGGDVTCSRCGSRIESCIVPPGARKDGVFERPLSLLWSLALGELWQATRIVVIGVSLAPGDFELRWLLREALRLRNARSSLDICVVNPDSGCHRAFTALLGRKVSLCGSLSDFVASL